VDLRKQILTDNDCYAAGRTIVPKGVMVHSTGANNPNLRRYVAPNDGLLGVPSLMHWNQPGTGACVHAFVGKLADGSVAAYQTLPWTMRGWHCGSGNKGSANNTHISFEICEDGLEDASYFSAVYQEAVELTAHLCKEYGLDPLADGVVICHAEGCQRGIASNHGDVLHWFGKHDKTMDAFRAAVARTMRGEIELTEAQIRAIVREEYTKLEAERAALPASDWAKAILEEAKGKGITDGTRPQSFPTRQETAAMILASTKD
jgi:hypothetical protein